MTNADNSHVTDRINIHVPSGSSVPLSNVNRDYKGDMI